MLIRKLTALLAVIIGCLCLVPGANATSPEQDSFCFTDALGREVRLQESPERVAALISSFADVWQLAGGTVCATAEDAWSDLALDLGDAVNLGGALSPSLEALLSSDPELVLASASTASNVEMKDALEAAGISVLYFDVDCFEDYLAMLDVCTDLTGRKDLYEQNGLTLQRRIEAIKAECAQAELPEEQRTVLLLRASSGFVKAKGSEGTILGEMLSDLGCVNLADNDTSLLETLSVEHVIREEPYRIFVVTMGDDTQKALDNLARMMEENPAWGLLEAVQEDRLHVMDRKLFNLKPNANWATSYEILRDILLDAGE